MNLLYTNADVLTRAKLMKLTIEINKDQPEIVAVVEAKTKIFKRILTAQDCTIPGFDLELHGLGADEKSGGVALYIHKSLSYTRLVVIGDDMYKPYIVAK